jgi:tripartite-type tricarboxylate transporter receptor subunit TctC
LNKPFAAALAAVAVAAFASTVHSQTYPTKPVRLVVGFAPGGPTDIVARLVAQKISGPLGQQVLVDNRAGAAGTVGAEAVAKSPKDGYTLLLGTISMLGLAPSTFPRLGYDPRKDFAPISLLTNSWFVIAVNAETMPTTLKQFIALAKANPGKFNFASNGAGNITHIAGEMFNLLTGTKLVHVPYKGTAPAALDVAAGRAHVQFDVPTAFQAHTGKVRLLAITGPKRDPQLPNVPTTVEAGLPQFTLSAWFGLVTTAGTPEPIVRRLNAEVVKALGESDVRASIVKLGLEPAPSTPEQFAAVIEEENSRWPKIVKAAGLKFE